MKSSHPESRAQEFLKSQLSRRRLLQAAGLAAAAPAFLHGGGAVQAQAAAAPLRLVCWPLMNGAEAQYFYPGGADASTLSTVTQPLGKYGSLATFVKGLKIDGAENHFAVRATYTGGSVTSYDSPDPTFKSVDQMVADSIAAKAPTAQKSVHLGVIPADSIQYYKQGRNKFFYSPTPVDYEANPVTAYDRLFGGAAAMPPKAMGADYTNDTLDIVDAEMAELDTRIVGATSEVNKLQLHKDALKALRASSSMPMMTTPIITGPLASVEKIRPQLQGKTGDAYKYSYFSDMFDAQVDNMARVLISGMSRVVTLQAGSADNDLIVPVDQGYPHHLTSHGDQPTFAKLQNWYFGKMARFMAALDVADPLAPGTTVLDNTVIVIIAECLPYTHSSNGVPALLLGKLGGKLQTNRVIDAKGASNKTLMSTVLKAFEVDPDHFGTTTLTGVLA
ncbi:MAG TPA: DUF1552 domain-containing protein [Polyangiaceae bacterium]|nr:DUF1552 domain-containing protein [Polyangiaceae bacterium]